MKRQSRCFVFVAALLCLLATGKAYGQAQPPEAPKKEEAAAAPSLLPAPMPLTPVNPAADARLRGEVVLYAKWARIDAILEALARHTGVPIKADDEIAGRRVNLFMLPPRASAGQDMAALARVTGLTWVADEAGTGYRLIRSEARKKAEERAMRASEQREETRRRVCEQALLQKLKEEIRRSAESSGSGKPGFGTYLAAFTDAQLQEVAASAQGHVPVISASDQRHFYPFFLHPRPFSELPTGAQQAVRSLTTREEYPPTAGSRQYKPAASGPDALAKCQFGLVAAVGMVYMALYNPEGGDLWVSPFEQVWSPTAALNLAEVENDFDPAVTGWIENPNLVSGLPRELATRKIRFPAKVDRTHLAALLEFMAQEVKLASASEDFLRTRATPPYIRGLLPPDETFTVKEALRQIARTFGQRMVYDRNSGVLYVTTLTRGRDLRAEPPAELLARLGSKGKERIPLNTDDIADLGGLSPLQLETLLERCPADLTFMRGIFHWVLYGYPVIRLYSLLDKEQRAAAESDEGFAVAETKGAARRWHEEGLNFRGLPSVDAMPQIDAAKPGRFYVRRNGEEWSFLVSLRQNPVTLLSHRISLPQGKVSLRSGGR